MRKGLILFTSCLFQCSIGGICRVEARGETQTINGSANLRDVNFSALEVHGRLKFETLFVENSLEVNGSTKGNHLRCKELQTNGSAKLTDIQATSIESNGSFEGRNIRVEKTLTISGKLEAEHIQVLGTTKVSGSLTVKEGKMNHVQLASTRVTFVHSSVTSLFVEKLQNKTTQIIELQEGSVVSGDITFASGNGEIHLSGDSVVKGKVIGARIVRK